MSEFTVPPALERGDKVAIVAPASGLAEQVPHVYELGIERIQSTFDLEPIEYSTARKPHEYLYAHPEDRAQDIMDAFENPEIRGVIATAGGNDQIRILKHLNPEVLRENPTRFYGWSDSTNLALYLWNIGIVSFYGGMVTSEYAMEGEMLDYTVEHLNRALFDDTIGAIDSAPEFTDDHLNLMDPENLQKHREMESNPGWTWANGTSQTEGRLWGGCLSMLVMQFFADRYLPEPDTLDGAILAVETSEKLPDAVFVQEWLRGLGERGLLKQLGGVLVGRAPARSYLYPREDAEERRQYRNSQHEVIMDAMNEYNPDAPVVFDLDFGHTSPSVPIPIGGRVEIDPSNERIVFS